MGSTGSRTDQWQMNDVASLLKLTPLNVNFGSKLLAHFRKRSRFMKMKLAIQTKIFDREMPFCLADLNYIRKLWITFHLWAHSFVSFLANDTWNCFNWVESYGPGPKITHFWCLSTKMMVNWSLKMSILNMVPFFYLNWVESFEPGRKMTRFWCLSTKMMVN